jgi:hypothetical protein
MTRCQQSIFLAGLTVLLAVGSATAQIMPGFGLPLYFEADSTPEGVPQYLARSRTSEVLVSARAVQISLGHVAPVQMQFPGANPQAHIQGHNEQTGKINYLVGNNSAQWRTGVPTFARVGIENLYPGIDAVYYGNEQQLEYDFTIAPGAKPEAIALRITGATKISIDPAGELDMSVGKGDVVLRKPVIYQTVDGARRNIAGGYKIDGQTVAFTVGNYDPHAALVIDPILTYSSYLGGNGAEEAIAVAVNTNDGSIFVAGKTEASNLGSTGALQTTNEGNLDAFVAKFKPQGTNMNLVYFTYLGGSEADVANAIAVDSAGNAFVGGYTDSANFPTNGQLTGLTNHINGAIDSGVGGTGTYPLDGFVTELAPSGASLVYSVYLGGNQEDSIQALAIDGADNVYVTGYTFSTNLPVKYPVAYTLAGSGNHTLSTLACRPTAFNCNAFIAKISPGPSVGWLTYFGGTNFDHGTGIAVDGANNVYVTGFTDSTNFPNTNAFQVLLNQTPLVSYVDLVFDGFVAKLGPASAGSAPSLLYSTFLGNTNTDEAYHIAVDTQGAAYVTGFTTSTNFYNTTTKSIIVATNTIIVGGQPTNIYITKTTYPVITTRITNNVNGTIYTTNVFLTKIVQTNANQHASIAYSVVFGGSYEDVGYGVAVDPSGNAFVTGTGNSPNFPTNNTYGLLLPIDVGNNDVFVTAFNSTCSQVLYSGHLGGVNDDYGFAIAVDNHSTAYVVGLTTSVDFPVTTNSSGYGFISNGVVYGARSKTINSAGLDAFFAEIALDAPPSISISRPATNQFTLSWPTYPQAEPDVAGFSLESTTNLSTNAWVPVTDPIDSNTTSYFVTLPETNSHQFFRLVNTNNPY